MSEPPVEAYELFEVLCDVMGPAERWPKEMFSLFWCKNVTHINRMKICAFAYVNGLGPELLLEWVDLVGLARDVAARKEFQSWINAFYDNPSKWHSIYGYNMWWNRYEYIDGRVKHWLPIGKPHP